MSILDLIKILLLFTLIALLITIYSSSRANSHPESFESITAQADSLFHSSDFSQALKYYNKALDFENARHNPYKNKLITALGNVGYMYYQSGSYSNAIIYFTDAIKICRTISDSVELSINLANISQCFFYQGDYSAALVYMTEALEIEKMLGNEEKIAIREERLGLIYMQTGDYNRAGELFNRSLETFRAISNFNS
jgi:tetratricopeptide (TPR) repeat protein